VQIQFNYPLPEILTTDGLIARMGERKARTEDALKLACEFCAFVVSSYFFEGEIDLIDLMTNPKRTFPIFHNREHIEGFFENYFFYGWDHTITTADLASICENVEEWFAKFWGDRVEWQ